MRSDLVWCAPKSHGQYHKLRSSYAARPSRETASNRLRDSWFSQPRGSVKWVDDDGSVVRAIPT